MTGRPRLSPNLDSAALGRSLGGSFSGSRSSFVGIPLTGSWPGRQFSKPGDDELQNLEWLLARSCLPKMSPLDLDAQQNNLFQNSRGIVDGKHVPQIPTLSEEQDEEKSQTSTLPEASNPEESATYIAADKPALSYSNLILLSILSSPRQAATVNEMYQWCKKTFPYYQDSECGWKNSLRHNLSLNRGFQKLPKSTLESGRGALWTVNPQFRHSMLESIHRNPMCLEILYGQHQPQQTATVISSSASFTSSLGSRDFRAAPPLLLPNGWVDLPESTRHLRIPAHTSSQEEAPPEPLAKEELKPVEERVVVESSAEVPMSIDGAPSSAPTLDHHDIQQKPQSPSAANMPCSLEAVVIENTHTDTSHLAAPSVVVPPSGPSRDKTHHMNISTKMKREKKSRVNKKSMSPTASLNKTNEPEDRPLFSTDAAMDVAKMLLSFANRWQETMELVEDGIVTDPLDLHAPSDCIHSGNMVCDNTLMEAAPNEECASVRSCRSPLSV